MGCRHNDCPQHTVGARVNSSSPDWRCWDLVQAPDWVLAASVPVGLASQVHRAPADCPRLAHCSHSCGAAAHSCWHNRQRGPWVDAERSRCWELTGCGGGHWGLGQNAAGLACWHCPSCCRWSNDLQVGNGDQEPGGIWVATWSVGYTIDNRVPWCRNCPAGGRSSQQ